jgi:hypothetical protein
VLPLLELSQNRGVLKGDFHPIYRGTAFFAHDFRDSKLTCMETGEAVEDPGNEPPRTPRREFTTKDAKIAKGSRSES